MSKKQQLAVELLLSRELLRTGTVGTTFTVPPGSGMSGQVADTIIAAPRLAIVTNSSGGGVGAADGSSTYSYSLQQQQITWGLTRVAILLCFCVI